jgi:hypothetical protein
MKTVLALATLAFFASTSPAQASPVDVTYTVSGGAGNWTLDFSVGNNLGGTNNIYYFGVRLFTTDIAASPSFWGQLYGQSTVQWSNPSYGGSNTTYDNLWITDPTGSGVIRPGTSLDGFKAFDTNLIAPPSVSWFAVAAGGTFDPALGCNFICNPPYDNPGFESIANLSAAPSPSPVPEPATSAMLVLGLVAGAIWTRRQS